MKKFIRNILFGDTPVSEYSTVRVEGKINERVWLSMNGTLIDISTTHWLLCLNPVVFGIWFSKDDIIPFDNEGKYRIYFKDSVMDPATVAIMKLDFFNRIEENDGTLFLLKLAETKIRHLNFIRTRLIFYRYYKKPEQDFKKLKSYSAAYSYPRRVRIISFKEGSWFNIFPMDLVGDIPHSSRYVFGLRHTNVTLDRMIETKKLAVSEVPFECKDVIYQLGKHHREPLSEGSLPFGVVPSETYDFPIPEWADSYKEIRIVDTMNLGSHMLLWGEEVNEKILNPSRQHLFHIHFLHYLHQKRKGLDYPLV
jgi:hypothetical protein